MPQIVFTAPTKMLASGASPLLAPRYGTFIKQWFPTIIGSMNPQGPQKDLEAP